MPAKLRRRHHLPPDLARLQPLSFHADTSDLDVNTVHVFSELDRIALSFVTTQGTIDVTLPPSIAQQIAGGIIRLNQAGR
jgi:hypothetical protein